MYLLAIMLHDLRVEGLAQRAEHGQPHESEHGQTKPGKKWNLLVQRQCTQSDEEDQNAEGDAVRVIRKKVRRPEQEDSHRGHIKNGGKRQS